MARGRKKRVYLLDPPSGKTGLSINITDEIEPFLKDLLGTYTTQAKSALKSTVYKLHMILKKGLRKGIAGNTQLAKLKQFKKYSLAKLKLQILKNKRYLPKSPQHYIFKHGLHKGRAKLPFVTKRHYDNEGKVLVQAFGYGSVTNRNEEVVVMGWLKGSARFGYAVQEGRRGKIVSGGVRNQEMTDAMQQYFRNLGFYGSMEERRERYKKKLGDKRRASSRLGLRGSNKGQKRYISQQKREVLKPFDLKYRGSYAKIFALKFGKKLLKKLGGLDVPISDFTLGGVKIS